MRTTLSELWVIELQKVFVFFVCVIVSAFNLRSAFANSIENRFALAGNRYDLSIEKIEGSQNQADGSSLYRYSVKRNGQVQSFEGVGGVVSTCYGQVPVVKDISTTKQPVAWLVLTGGLCGNTFSYRALVIAPDLSSSFNNGKYTEISFLTKHTPVIQPHEKSVDLWYSEQFWGSGGTAVSVFLPKLMRLSFGDFGIQREMGLVSSRLKDLPAIETKLGLQSYFPSLYIAGLQNLDTNLMNFALSCCYKTSEVDQYSSFFKQTDRAYLVKLTQKIENLRKLSNETSGAQNWGFSSSAGAKL